jgi:hypothetical protein
MIFKLPDDLGRQGYEFGIFVQPSWYERPFRYDATVKCAK